MSYIFLAWYLTVISDRSMCCMGYFRSQYFLFKNGVMQGGVLSPIFFTIHIDKLLVMLRTTGIGCHLGSAYVGALSYAADITLLCPNVPNPKKTVCIKFGSKINIDDHVSMNGFTVQWSERVRHLGRIC